MNFKIVLFIGALIGASALHAQEIAKGSVYLDLNKNGRKDKNEVGLPLVSISNGREVVQTDRNGRYTIPVGSDNIIFIIKPRDFEIPLDVNNHPKSYYIHKPKGSPALKYSGTEPTGALPKSLDFGLYSRPEQNQFKVFVFGDPQAYNLDELAYFKKGIIDDITNKDSVYFGISLGDLVGDNLTLHDPYKETIATVGIPWYNVMGNHDMNYDVEVDSLSDESFEKTFGPNNYSFNYGNAHFIILDNIIYPNPRTGKGYLGGFRNDQLEFVENDLKFVPKDRLIVLAFHIPILHNKSDVFRNEDRQRLFDILRDYPNTVSLSAHTHFQQQNFYGAEDGWKQSNPHHEYNVGTTSGDWYSGQLDRQGIPSSTMRDGTPKGYAVMSVINNTYRFDYKVSGQKEDFQMNVIGPQTIKSKHTKRYKIYANFFLGSKNDLIEYRIDGKEWKKMNRVDEVDPSYQYEVLKFDNAEQYIDGRRPSNAVNSTHLWMFDLPNLKVGSHEVELRVKDMYGKIHYSQKSIQVIE